MASELLASDILSLSLSLQCDEHPQQRDITSPSIPNIPGFILLTALREDSFKHLFSINIAMPLKSIYSKETREQKVPSLSFKIFATVYYRLISPRIKAFASPLFFDPSRLAFKKAMMSTNHSYCLRYLSFFLEDFLIYFLFCAFGFKIYFFIPERKQS